MTTIYVKKDEEKVYNALLLDSLTVHDLKLGVRGNSVLFKSELGIGYWYVEKCAGYWYVEKCAGYWYAEKCTGYWYA